jgi:hypothetical protein
MVLISLVRDYIDRMLHDIPGMKVLVLDPRTVRARFPEFPYSAPPLFRSYQI